jgi:hypothetical protein
MGSYQPRRKYRGWRHVVDELPCCTQVIASQEYGYPWQDEQNGPDDNNYVLLGGAIQMVVFDRHAFNVRTLRRGDRRSIPDKVL